MHFHLKAFHQKLKKRKTSYSGMHSFISLTIIIIIKYRYKSFLNNHFIISNNFIVSQQQTGVRSRECSDCIKQCAPNYYFFFNVLIFSYKINKIDLKNKSTCHIPQTHQTHLHSRRHGHRRIAEGCMPCCGSETSCHHMCCWVLMHEKKWFLKANKWIHYSLNIALHSISVNRQHK